MRISLRLRLVTTVLALLLLPTVSFAQETSGELTNGQEIYKKNCVRCHGINGEGNGPDAQALMVPPANFQSPESRAKMELELRSAVVWGLAFSPMHGWFDKLTTQEMRAVVQHIRRIAPYRPRTY